MAHDHRSERPTRRGRVDDSGGDTDGGKQALLPPHPARRERGRLPQPHPALEPGLPGGLLLQAPHGLGAAREVLRGSDRHHGLPRRSRPAVIDQRGDEKGAFDKAGRLQEIFGKDNLFVELQDHGIPEQHQTNPKLLEIAKKHRCPAPGHQRPPLHPPGGPRVPRRPPVRPDRRAHLRSEAVQVPRRGALPQVRRRRCATSSARCPRRATTPSGSPSGPISRSPSARPSCPNFPLPGGVRQSDSSNTSTTSPGRGRKKRWGERAPAVGRRAGRLRAQGHQRHGLRVLLPDHLGPHPVRPARPASGSVRAGARRPGVRWRTASGSPTSIRFKLRPAVRAVPQPESGVDARHRHGLRLPVPRPDDPVCRRARTDATTSPRSSPSARSRPATPCATRRACSATRTAPATRSPRRCRRS